MATSGRLQLLNMSLAKQAVDKLRAPSSGNSRIIPGRLPQRIGVMRGDAAAAGVYSASALQGTDAHLLSRAYYTADFHVATQHEGVSWAPKVALMVTALAAMFLIGIIGLFIMSKDISANILAHDDYRVSEYDGFDPASSRSPLRIASKATLGSSTPRSDQHHHGPRYADDGVSQTTDRATEAPAATALGSAERTEEAAAKTDTEEKRADSKTACHALTHCSAYGLDSHQSFLPKQTPKHGCYVALHKYCVKVRDEYYYQPAVNACVMTPTDSTVVCNHSRNKFVSHASCRKNCVESAVPAEKCFHTATFSMCTRHDVRHKWWYYDGSRCQSWNFPLGACPSLTDADGGEAFTSRHECTEHCEVAGDQQQPHLNRRCIPPVREPCTAHQLR
ncbi:hypothetical protein HPB51_028067 [Rhipicephalus microplus]|uniref:BPTI/Kunitz inhibitor domain-containing protein n=1 Tax=Rhipicephalus microplus TaxID=6941 RepID=A0A9J6CYB5_RHIMP|nr:hypothetical protein HPB51_028067 [Rhipicephalus microplus]